MTLARKADLVFISTLATYDCLFNLKNAPCVDRFNTFASAVKCI